MRVSGLRRCASKTMATSDDACPSSSRAFESNGSYKILVSEGLHQTTLGRRVEHLLPDLGVVGDLE